MHTEVQVNHPEEASQTVMCPQGILYITVTVPRDSGIIINNIIYGDSGIMHNAWTNSSSNHLLAVFTTSSVTNIRDKLVQSFKSTRH